MKDWKLNEIEILRHFFGKILVSEIHHQYLPNRSQPAIRNKAKTLQLKGNPSETRKKYQVNDMFFHVPNILNCYWAGLLAADGNISSNKKYRLRLKLKDKDHIEKFKADIGFTGPINRNVNKNGKEYWEISINSKQIIEDLTFHFKLSPKKTETLTFPGIVDENLVHSFIIGYIDGDGCIHYEIPKNGNPRLRLHLIGNKDVLLWIKKYLDIISPSNANILKMKRNSFSYTYCIACLHAKNVLHYLNRLDVPKMARKWDLLKLLK